MHKAISATALALVIGASVVGSAAGANPKASCNGSLVSSLAGQPGAVSAATREFHDQFKDLGIPPGFFDKAGAQEHGSVEECLEILGG